MSKAPLVRDALLAGEIAVTLVANTETVHASIHGTVVTAAHLRSLADELCRLQAARDVFFDMKEYAITFQPVSSDLAEDSVIIVASTAQEAADRFRKERSDFIRDVFNRKSMQSEAFE